MFSFDLLDRDGGEIRATAFGAEADKFFEIIEVGSGPGHGHGWAGFYSVCVSCPVGCVGLGKAHRVRSRWHRGQARVTRAWFSSFGSQVRRCQLAWRNIGPRTAAALSTGRCLRAVLASWRAGKGQRCVWL